MTYTLAGDLGGTKMAAALIDAAGHVIFEQSQPTQADQGIETVTDRLASLLNEVRASANEKKPSACGVAVLGLVDTVTGEMRFAANLPGAQGYPLQRRLETALGLPVVIENDIRSHALGEYTFGAARGLDNFLFVAVGTGIGGTFYVNGRLYPGAYQVAGEIGHIVVDSSPTAPRCGCGLRGCLETLASGPAIVADFLRQATEQGVQLETDSVNPEGTFSLQKIAEWANHSDARGALAKQAIENGARILGRGLGSGVNLLDPGHVILGGGVAQLGSRWLDIVRQTMGEHVLPQLKDTAIELAQLGSRAALAGASVLAREGLHVH
jgi:glucokinase